MNNAVKQDEKKRFRHQHLRTESDRNMDFEEGDLNFILQTSADRSEGISSFINKTTPNYYGK